MLQHFQSTLSRGVWKVLLLLLPCRHGSTALKEASFHIYLNSVTSMVTTDKLYGICGGYVHLHLQTAMRPAQVQISTATVILAFRETGMCKYCLCF